MLNWLFCWAFDVLLYLFHHTMLKQFEHSSAAYAPDNYYRWLLLFYGWKSNNHRFHAIAQYFVLWRIRWTNWKCSTSFAWNVAALNWNVFGKSSSMKWAEAHTKTEFGRKVWNARSLLHQMCVCTGMHPLPSGLQCIEAYKAHQPFICAYILFRRSPNVR